MKDTHEILGNWSTTNLNDRVKCWNQINVLRIDLADILISMRLQRYNHSKSKYSVLLIHVVNSVNIKDAEEKMQNN